MGSLPGAGHLVSHQRGSLRKEGKQWVLRFKEHTDERVIYRAVRVGPTSELRTRGSARAMADSIMATEVGAAVSGTRIRFSDYVPRWAASHMRGIVRPSTAASWECVLRLHLVPWFGCRYLAEIDVKAVQHFIAECGRAGKSTARIQNITSLLRQILRQAAKDGYATQPIGPYTLRFPKDGRRHAERRCFTPEEMRAILVGANFPHKAMYAVMAHTGMRCGEVLGLQWSAVDFFNARIHVRQAAVMGRIYLPKTARSVAMLPLSPELKAILQEYADWQDHAGGHIAERRYDLMFPGPKGAPLHAGGVRVHHFTPLLERLGIPHGGLHAFRHGLATSLFSAGAPPAVVQGTLRHGNLRTTMSYSHTTPEANAGWLEKTSQRITGAVTP